MTFDRFLTRFRAFFGLFLCTFTLTGFSCSQVTVAPAPFVKPQYFNGSVPCNACLLYSYAAGTTTPLVTYTDSTGVTPNSDPVVLDVNGQGNVWLGSSVYKLVLKTSAGVTLWTVDGIKGGLVAPSLTGPVIITDSTPSDTALQVTNSGNSSIGVKISASGTNSAALDATNAGTGKIATLKNSGSTEVLGVTQTGIKVNSGTELTTTNQSGTGSIAMTASPTFTGTINADTIIASNPVTGGAFSSTGSYVTNGGQFRSTTATGTAPLLITSTTPVVNLAATPTTYNAAGTQITGTHIVRDTCVLGTNCVVTLAGAAAFADTNYVCTASDATAANAVKIVNTAAGTVTITGTGTDSINFSCVGK